MTLRHSFPEVSEASMVVALQRSRNSMIGAAELLRDPFLSGIGSMPLKSEGSTGPGDDDGAAFLSASAAENPIESLPSSAADVPS